MFPNKISDGKLLDSQIKFDPGSRAENASQLIISEINEIDAAWVLRWFKVDIAHQEQIEHLKYGIGYTSTIVGAFSLKDRMLNLNSILADLRVQLVNIKNLMDFLLGRSLT